MILKLQDVSMKYQSRLSSREAANSYVLKNISMELAVGDTLGLVGRNGSGKSTLLRLIAGIFSPTSGRMQKDRNTTFCLLALGAGLMPDLTGRDNAVFGSILRGNRRNEAIEKLPQIREFTELGEAFYRPVRTYSAGMKARLNFGIAVAVWGGVMLVDEVFAVGDGQFREKARKLMSEKLSQNGSHILVSHSPGLIKQFCSDALWLENGEVRDFGSAPDIVDSYEESLKAVSSEASVSRV